MQSERDLLRTHVFPALEERLREHHVHLEWVDLRVGLAAASEEDSDSREEKVLKVCLAEVRRCKPFFIFLLGDRYGTVPSTPRAIAALEEEGLPGELSTYSSVTALEILAAMYHGPAQDPRSFFYLREPLPYAKMPPEIAAGYSEEYSKNALGKEKSKQLFDLKKRVTESFPDRVKRYHAQWDASRNRVTGLEAWAAGVVEDIWAELRASLAAIPKGAERTLYEEERDALEDFVEDRTRGFCGRKEIIEELFAHCLNNTGPPGLCVTGEPGAGKSAVFAALYKRLKGADATVLAHSAGAGPQAGSVDILLRRWITELAAKLGKKAEIDANPLADLEALFAGLLGDAAGKKRVVLLLDALDQFEDTPAGRLATWLPDKIPGNVRMVVTTANLSKDGLIQRTDFGKQELAAITRAEALEIVDTICRRYHRSFEPEVMDALLGKRSGAGFAFVNPLWLALASEELNLIDADDFDVVEQKYSGDYAEKLLAFILDRVATMPGDAKHLYSNSFGRAEKLFGTELTRATLALIAHSRGGWRESDFRVLIPDVSNDAWDELQFALLRRYFRGQLWQRGPLMLWDCRHNQMRRAIEEWSTDLKLHGAIANHLRALPRTDPLRESEAMFHLLRCPNKMATLFYFGDDEATEGEINAAAATLAEDIVRSPSTALAQLSFLNRVSEIPAWRATNRALYLVFDAVVTKVNLETRKSLAYWFVDQCNSILMINRNAFFVAYAAGDYAAALMRAGEAELELNEEASAENLYRQSLSISKQLVTQNPDAHEWHRDLSVCYNKLGNLQKRRGELSDAEKTYRDALTAITKVSQSDPEPEWARDIAIGYMNVGDAQMQQSHWAGAESSYAAALARFLERSQRQPKSIDRKNDLSAVYERLGEVATRQRRYADAESWLTKALDIRNDSLRLDPQSTIAKHLAGLVKGKQGLLEIHRGNVVAAEAYLRQAIAYLKAASDADAANLNWLLEVSKCRRFLAQALGAQSRNADAESELNAAAAVAKRRLTEGFSDDRLAAELFLIETVRQELKGETSGRDSVKKRELAGLDKPQADSLLERFAKIARNKKTIPNPDS